MCDMCRFDGYRCYRNLCCFSRFYSDFCCSRFVEVKSPRKVNFVPRVLRSGF